MHAFIAKLKVSFNDSEKSSTAMLGGLMSSIVKIVAIGMGIALITHSLIVMLRFKTFCEAVATAQDQLEELANPIGTGESGLNRFETQQINLLLNGKFEQAYEGELLERARVIARQLRHNLVAAICFVAGLGIYYFAFYQ